jgi:hypothetical protein
MTISLTHTISPSRTIKRVRTFLADPLVVQVQTELCFVFATIFFVGVAVVPAKEVGQTPLRVMWTFASFCLVLGLYRSLLKLRQRHHW